MHTPHVIPLTVTTPPKPASSPPAARPTQNKSGPKPDEGGGLRILTYLRLHWLMITFCGTLLGGGAAYAAWELLDSKYESYGLFQVSSVPATVASAGNREQARTDFVTYLKTTSALMKSEFVLNAAMRDMKDLPTIKAQKDPMKFLDEELIVTWQDGSEVIRIAFKSHEPADAKRIVDAVQNAFVKEVVEKDIKEKRIFLQQVEQAKQDMRKILDRKSERDRPSVAKEANPTEPSTTIPAGGVLPANIPNVMPAGGPAAMLPPPPPITPDGLAAGPLPPMPTTGQPPADNLLNRLDPHILVNRYAGLMQEAERLPLQINDGKRRLVVLQQKMEAIKMAPVSQLTIDAVEKDTDVIIQILKTRQAKRDYEFRRGSGDDAAPGVVELKDKWEAHEARLVQLRKEKAEIIESAKRIAEAQKIAAEMEDLIRNLQKLQEQQDFVKKALEKAEKQVAELPPEKVSGGPLDLKEAQKYNASFTDLIGTDEIYHRLVQQYYLTQMELSSPPRVRVLQPGSNPTQKEIKKQVLGTIFAALMGFGLMAFGVIAFETATKRVSSLADVKSAIPTPIVGVIPCLPSEAMGKDPAKRNAANEAIDKLRAYVAQTWLARGATAIAVTSPLGDEGKAFTAFGLASSLSQSGYKTLLVDFDLRDPQLHELAGVANGAGVCELLRSEIDPRSALQFLPSGLHLLPAGKWSDEARKAATGEKLELLLSKLRGPYDCVVMHGHALLTAAESVEVARRCEVVLVCALYRTTTTPLLKRAAERVATMEIPYSGIVYVGATEQEGLC